MAEVLFCVLYWKGEGKGGIGLCVSPTLFSGVDDANFGGRLRRSYCVKCSPLAWNCDLGNSNNPLGLS